MSNLLAPNMKNEVRPIIDFTFPPVRVALVAIFSGFYHQAASLRLEHEERLVMALKQVEEEHEFGLIGDRRCEAFARDHVPTGCLVLEVGVRLNLHLDLRGQIFVYFAFLGGLFDQSNGFVDHVPRHVGETDSMRGKGLNLHFFFR